MSTASDFIIENGVLKQYAGPGGDVVVPEGVTEIAVRAFERGRGITRVSFPKGVRSIPTHALWASADTLSEIVLYDDYPRDNIGRMTDSYFPENSVDLEDRSQYLVTVKAADTDAVKYRIFLCGETETQDINAALITAWGPNASFRFPAIDNLFSHYKDMTDRLITAKLRLDYPVELSEDLEKSYRSFIRRNGYKWFPKLIEAGDEGQIRWLIENGAVTKTRVDSLIELASKSGKTAITAMLMDHKAKNFGNTEPELDLSEKTPILWEVKKGSPELLWRYNGTDAELTLPTEWNGSAICGVADTVAMKPENYQLIEKLVIPEGYHSIGKDAFSGCRNLKEIVFPATLESLGENCFSGCVSLRRVELPDSLQTLGAGVFENCSALEEVRLPAQLQWIPDQAFLQCVSLKSIVFPETLRSIGTEAFRYCPALKEIDLGENVKYLGDRCFYMTNLKTVVIRGKKCYAGDSPCFEYPRYVYTDCEIQAVGLPQASRMPLSYLGLKNEELAEQAGYTYLKGLSVCSLGALRAFPKVSDCRYSNMEFSEFIERLGGSYSNRLTKTSDLLVTYQIDRENTTIQRAIRQGTAILCELDFLKLVQGRQPIDLSAWRLPAADDSGDGAGKAKAPARDDPYRPALMKKLWGYTEQDDGTIRLNSYKGEETAVEIPPRIGGKAVTVIGKGALSPVGPRASNLTARKEITEVSIPDSITCIEEKAFMRCRMLRDLRLPPQLCSVGSDAFHACESLTEITIPDSVTEIGPCCFESCTSLKRIVLPEGIRELKRELFSGCTSLESIRIPAGVKEIGHQVFRGCEALREVKLPESIEVIDGYAFGGCRALKDIEIPAGLTAVGDGAFRGCEGLADENGWVIVGGMLFGYYGEGTDLIVPDGVRAVSPDALKENPRVQSIVLPDGLKRIGSHAFENCTALERIRLPDSIEKMEWDVFSGCGRLSGVVLPASLKELSHDSFKNCNSLQEITLPASIETVDGSVFSGCSSLETVTVLGKDTRFEKSYIWGDLAFDNCAALKAIHTPNPNALPVRYRGFAIKAESGS